MSVYSSYDDSGRYAVYVGENGSLDGDIVIETQDVGRFDTFLLSNGAGSVDVEVFDGVQWLTSPLSMADLGATNLDPVLTTSALRQYGWRGFYQQLRIRQNGGIPATGVVLRCSRIN